MPVESTLTGVVPTSSSPKILTPHSLAHCQKPDTGRRCLFVGVSAGARQKATVAPCLPMADKLDPLTIEYILYSQHTSNVAGFLKGKDSFLGPFAPGVRVNELHICLQSFLQSKYKYCRHDKTKH